MATPELQRKWAAIQALLLEAAVLLPSEAKYRHEKLMQAFTDFLDQNEFELALDMLELVAEDFPQASRAAFKTMAKAADIMGLHSRGRFFDQR